MKVIIPIILTVMLAGSAGSSFGENKKISAFYNAGCMSYHRFTIQYLIKKDPLIYQVYLEFLSSFGQNRETAFWKTERRFDGPTGPIGDFLYLKKVGSTTVEFNGFPRKVNLFEDSKECERLAAEADM